MKAVFYTEGGADYGLGHVVRCSSLATALTGFGIGVRFVVKGFGVDGFLPTDSCIYADWDKFVDFDCCDIAIVDSYTADLEIYQKIKCSSKILVAIDDEMRLDYPADIILNSTVGAENWSYPKGGVSYLLGSKYFLARSGFGFIKPKKIKDKVENIVIALGGSDVLGIAVELSKALIEGLPEAKKTLIVGPGFKNKDSLFVLQSNSFECLYSPDANRLGEIFEDSDLAVCAGGQTLYELAAFGVPTVAFWVVKNQIPDIEGFFGVGFLDGSCFYEKQKVLEALKSLAADRPKREKLSKIGQNTVSADGAKIVCEHILKTTRERG